ncbi:NUDIX hydrolase [Vibrio sonorensis]|uniref:NUDIX hydrolase n=1 Tax=Vibrio sonorensis TaxID=1004316 RepID=UPI0008DAE856|nr:NUDIX hydrolase [Vibrio sonorensis]
MNPWLDWAKQLQAISQTGHAYSKDDYDLERFTQIGDIAHQMFAELSDTPVEKVKNLFISESGYPTPKVDLRAAVIKDGQILLVREREDGRWTLPGGWADVCETPSQGVVREVFEESGLVVDNPRLIAIKDRAVHDYTPVFAFHIYKFFFLCNYVSGEPTSNIEVSEVGYFSPNNLPPLSESRVLESDIETAFSCHNNPSVQVYID